MHSPMQLVQPAGKDGPQVVVEENTKKQKKYHEQYCNGHHLEL